MKVILAAISLLFVNSYFAQITLGDAISGIKKVSSKPSKNDIIERLQIENDSIFKQNESLKSNIELRKSIKSEMIKLDISYANYVSSFKDSVRINTAIAEQNELIKLSNDTKENEADYNFLIGNWEVNSDKLNSNLKIINVSKDKVEAVLLRKNGEKVELFGEKIDVETAVSGSKWCTVVLTNTLINEDLYFLKLKFEGYQEEKYDEVNDWMDFYGPYIANTAIGDLKVIFKDKSVISEKINLKK